MPMAMLHTHWRLLCLHAASALGSACAKSNLKFRAFQSQTQPGSLIILTRISKVKNCFVKLLRRSQFLYRSIYYQNIYEGCFMLVLQTVVCLWVQKSKNRLTIFKNPVPERISIFHFWYYTTHIIFDTHNFDITEIIDNFVSK